MKSMRRFGRSLRPKSRSARLRASPLGGRWCARFDVDMPGVGRLHAEQVRATIRGAVTLWDLARASDTVRVHLPTTAADFIFAEGDAGRDVPLSPG